MAGKVSIIVPVYGDWSSLSDCIDSLKRHVSYFSGHQVYFMNDNGPEADAIETRIIEKIKYRRNFHYYRNKNNLGFLKNCNNAVLTIVDQKTDVLLLNSDTIVTRGFLKEMLRVLYIQSDIAAVCPRSNSATIFSVPLVQDPEHPVSAEDSYSRYRQKRPELHQYYISPIVHGFCMLIRREVINKFSLFDEVYGKGYGEENDFCMRVRENGWKCAVANFAYVFHMESRSFGHEERSRLVEEHEKILDKRYPEYRRLVGEYVGDLLNRNLEE